MIKTETIATPSRPRGLAPVTVIHFVDVDRIETELRPVCGAWGDHVTWTTVRAVMTCPACARLVRIPQPERRRDPATRTRRHGG
jgi:hypothetical protein